MRAADFKRWRKSLGLSQKQAADALGLKRRIIQYYEKGERDGEKVAVPKAVRLACWALAAGVTDYRGPDAKAESGTAAADEDDAEEDEDPPSPLAGTLPKDRVAG